MADLLAAPGPRPTRLRSDHAVRLALSAQGLVRTDERPGSRTDRGHVRRLVERIGALQLDSVNVVARAHLLPVRARLGDYDLAVLDAALQVRGQRRPVAWEYWGHEASYVPAGALAALRWRMHEAEDRAWGGMVDVARRRPGLLDDVVAVLADGPRTSRQLQALLEPGHRRSDEHWGWNWSDVKRAVEMAFWAGRVTSAGRTAQFERRYDLPERVWPEVALRTPWPARADAVTDLVERAARACGVATADDVRDYYRLPVGATRDALGRLVEEGVLQPVAVDGWGAPAWRHTGVPLPRAAALAGPGVLLAPFDPLVWHRPRAERVFGFRYRIEIYVPAAKRVHGYYVLPFLHRGRLVARVDVKADRPRAALLVRSAWAEPAADADDVLALAAECRRLGAWLGCPDVVVEPRGDLAAALAPAVAALDVP